MIDILYHNAAIFNAIRNPFCPAFHQAFVSYYFPHNTEKTRSILLKPPKRISKYAKVHWVDFFRYYFKYAIAMVTCATSFKTFGGDTASLLALDVGRWANMEP